MPTASLTAFCDATILTGEAIVEGHALVVGGGKIVDLAGANRIPAEARRVSCAGLVLAPGLIDAQVNGGSNILLNNSPTTDSCLAIARAHRAYGTTGLLLTCISDTPGIVADILRAVRAARREDPGILGVHLEGPHLADARRGVHQASALRSLTAADGELYRSADAGIMLITLAPENVPPAAIASLAEHAVVSIGHSSADAATVRAALKAGASGFTHLYNGMGGLTAREPGVAGVALDDAESWCGLIADGHHVSPEMIRIALRAKPRGKLFLVSDAMAPAAADRQAPFELYGVTVHVENGRCQTAEGRLAGSCMTLLDAVRHCVKSVGVEIDEALRMASTYPAAFLGLGHRYGKLLPGYAADIIALNHDLELRDVWPAGYA